MICPIMSKPISYGTNWENFYTECIKSGCAWWCRREGCCSIPLIAENLYAICGEGATKKRPLQEIEELKTRAEQAEAKLREYEYVLKFIARQEDKAGNWAVEAAKAVLKFAMEETNVAEMSSM